MEFRAENSLLLREIISYLPRRDQLQIRKLNKNWDDEAKTVLKHNHDLQLRILMEDQLEDFLLTYAPPFPKMRLLPYMNICLQPAHMHLQRLEAFGFHHAFNISKLTVLIPKEIKEWIASKVKIFLNYFVSIEKLKIETARYSRQALVNPDTLEIIPTDLVTFPKLRELEIECQTSAIKLVDEIIQKSPNLKMVNLNLRESSEPFSSLTRSFLTKLHAFQIQKLSVIVYVHDVTGESNLLKELGQSDLKPKELSFCFGSDKEIVREFSKREYDAGLIVLQNWLQKLVGTGLEKLAVRSLNQYEGDIALPEKMSGIKMLDFGVSGIGREGLWQRDRQVNPSDPISHSQIPDLETVVTRLGVSLLKKMDVFPSVKKLVVEEIDPVYRNVRSYRALCPSPSSGYWDTQFPNLKILETFVMAGDESTLAPVFTKLINLTELTITFKFDARNEEPDKDIWDVLTGRLRPILRKGMPRNKIIPVSNNRNPRQTEVVTTIPAIQNMRKLKTLKLERCPPCTVLAIVHLTATNQLPQYDKLTMSIGRRYGFRLSKFYTETLENFHAHVEIQTRPKAAA